MDPGAVDAPADVAVAPDRAEATVPVQAEASVVEAAAADQPTTETGAEPVAEPVAVTVDDESATETVTVDASAPADTVVTGAQAGDEPVSVDEAPRKRMLMGNVVSDKGDRTIVVSIARRKKHRLYKKYITLTKKLKAHDPDNECRVGDLVRVVESRPLSREKRWRLIEIVKRAG
jgi:small subunit ribosomal protein S17